MLKNLCHVLHWKQASWDAVLPRQTCFSHELVLALMAYPTQQVAHGCLDSTATLRAPPHSPARWLY